MTNPERRAPPFTWWLELRNHTDVAIGLAPEMSEGARASSCCGVVMSVLSLLRGCSPDAAAVRACTHRGLVGFSDFESGLRGCSSDTAAARVYTHQGLAGFSAFKSGCRVYIKCKSKAETDV